MDTIPIVHPEIPVLNLKRGQIPISEVSRQEVKNHYRRLEFIYIRKYEKMIEFCDEVSEIEDMLITIADFYEKQGAVLPTMAKKGGIYTVLQNLKKVCSVK